MELTRDILLRGSSWNNVIDKMTPIFKGRSRRTNYNIFMLALSIGIMYDKTISKVDDAGLDVRNVPRNVLQNNDNGKLDFFFQAAILSTTTQDLTEDRRLELAFGEGSDTDDFDKLMFLVEFANFGVMKLEELIGSTPLESMENLKNFIVSTVEGRNMDIDALPDDILLEDDS